MSKEEHCGYLCKDTRCGVAFGRAIKYPSKRRGRQDRPLQDAAKSRYRGDIKHTITTSDTRQGSRARFSHASCYTYQEGDNTEADTRNELAT